MSLLGPSQHILHQCSYSPKHYCVSSAMMLCNIYIYVHTYLTNRFHVAVCLFSNRSQMTSKCGKTKKWHTYRKPNNETLYIDSNSNHPPTIIKHLPTAIGRRISDISSSKELFNQAKPHYESAPKQGGHDKKLMFTERKKPARTGKET